MISDQLEHRSLVEPIEFRSAENGKKLTASGVAVRYGVWSQPFPRNGRIIKERIKAGAATKSLQEREVKAYDEHDRKRYLARTKNGTLRIENSDTELAYEFDLPDTTVGRDLAAELERGDKDGSSIGLKSLPKDEKWTVADDGMVERTVGTMILDHISPTVDPIYADTPVALALRSFAEATGIEFRSVEAAGLEGLAALLDPDQLDDDNDGRKPTVVRRRLIV